MAEMFMNKMKSVFVDSSLKLRLLPIFLCAALVVLIGVPVTLATQTDTSGGEAVEVTSELKIVVEDEAVGSIELAKGDKVAVKLVAEEGSDLQQAVDTGEIQWQILEPKTKTWIDIYGDASAKNTLTYAKIFNMLDGDEAQVRVTVAYGETEYATENVTVAVVEESAEEETSVDEAEAEEDKEAAADDAAVEEEPASTFSLKSASAEDGIATAAEEAPELAEYSIVINYVFENGEIAGDPYTATLAAGSNFNTTVTHPTVQGYLPYVGEDAEASTEIVLNVTGIQADVTYTVTYKPTNVNYTVIHYQQNVGNDNYTEVERETRQDLTKSAVPEVAKTYDGFYALLYERPEIAADGSTVVEIYYDRNYYLMNFDLDGGYGVEPIYARYGTEIGDIATPTKAGYSFVGWQLNGEDAKIAETMPADNVTYKAAWKANDTAKVSVVFWGENADDEEYSYLHTGVTEQEAGKEYSFADSSSFYICGKEEHSHTSDCSLDCGKEEHTTHTEDCLGACVHTSHDLECYSAGYYDLIEVPKPNQIDTPSQDGVYTYTSSSRTRYYLYLDGKWYRAENGGFLGGGGDTQSISLNCDHVHTDACYSCEYHKHSASCYSCGKEAHAHVNACTQTGSGLDSGLWKLVKSETKTVAADGSTVINVYYDRVEYSVRFYKDQNCSDGNEYTDYRITAKWGESILSEWPTHRGSSSWLVEGKSNTWQNSIQIMPVGGAKFWGPKTGSGNHSAYYYVEALPGDSDTFVYNGVTYKLHHTDISVSSGNVTDEERYGIEGFTYKEGTANGQSYSNAKFYYTRNSYNLVFNDGYNDVRSESVKYEASLATYKDYKPEAPSAYEPGSVEFAGWYLNPECTGAEYKLADHTMPADNVLLYAKWVPVTHTVEFYLEQGDLPTAESDGTKIGETHPDLTVEHGNKVESVPAEPDNGDYTFIGWFYMEDGVEKAFDFANMPINKDMKVYGKWSSNVLKNYFVYYKLDGTDTEIADPTTGSALAGVTKTFDAKGGSDLYERYQEGYFPLIKSHSMTVDIEDETKNSFTFRYVQKDAVPYTVRYLEAGTDAVLAEPKVVSDNRKAVVTEQFQAIKGYMPDAYQKRLVVDGTDGAINEIVFYYTKDTEHAYYKVSHYTQNIDGETWTEYQTYEAPGLIGDTKSEESLEIDGFIYNSDIEGSLNSGVITANGLHLKLYYERNSYPYEVRYLEQGSGKELAPPKKTEDDGESILSGLFGQVVSESAINIENYSVVGDSSQTLAIKIEESQDEAKLNIITFYYEEVKVDINYVAVGPAGATNFGTVDPAKETVKISSGTAQGSTATPEEDYRFVGWYSDEACTKLVSEDARFTPDKVNGKNVAATYYAKFEYDLTTLTINKKVSGDADAQQSFIFVIKGDPDDARTKDVNLTVTVKGEGNVTVKDLPVGKYMVTEDTAWSWRYEADAAIQTVTATADGAEVKFTNTKTNNKWLDDEVLCENKFDVVSGS